MWLKQHFFGGNKNKCDSKKAIYLGNWELQTSAYLSFLGIFYFYSAFLNGVDSVPVDGPWRRTSGFMVKEIADWIDTLSTADWSK